MDIALSRDDSRAETSTTSRLVFSFHQLHQVFMYRLEVVTAFKIKTAYYHYASFPHLSYIDKSVWLFSADMFMILCRSLIQF
jgi:hypothetical protein